MKKVKPSKSLILLVVFCILAMSSCSHRNEQSKTLTEYSKRDNNELSGLYFYPTTIRMLAKILGDENGQALKEIEKGRLFFSWSDNDENVRETLKSFRSGIAEEGFEMLMQMNSSGNRIDIYMLDRETDDYVIFVDGDQGTFVFEILGNLSPASIRDISKLDMTKMMDLFELEAPKDKNTTDTLKTDSL